MSTETLRRVSDEKRRRTSRGSSGRTNNRKAKSSTGRKFFNRGMGLDLPFLIIVLILMVVGLIMMFSASYPVAYYNQNGDSFYFLKRQLIFVILGIACMLVISFIDYHSLHRLSYMFLGISYFSLILVLFLPAVNNVHRWVGVGSFGIQASEISKFAIILFMAHWGSLYYDKMGTIKYGVLPAVLLFGTTAGLLVLEPHFSGIVIIFLLTLIMLFISGINVKWLGMAGIVAVIAFFIAWATGMLSYAMQRMDGWGQALEYTTKEMWNTTWQTRNSLYAIGSGGLFGLGLGNSRQKYLFLPEPQNDFIFAIVCEELGLIGAITILLIFALLVWRGITLSLRAPDRFGKLLGIGLTSQIGLQVILNILVITDWLPNTGISLPFFSYGGSSMIVLSAQMGVVLSISRQANIEKA
ncbi:MAG: cell division protein FtsW [Ruminococcus sp.]|nr:cell division protein FtsW [Ruminococcus sp.]